MVNAHSSDSTSSSSALLKRTNGDARNRAGIASYTKHWNADSTKDTAEQMDARKDAYTDVVVSTCTQDLHPLSETDMSALPDLSLVPALTRKLETRRAWCLFFLDISAELAVTHRTATMTALLSYTSMAGVPPSISHGKSADTPGSEDCLDLPDSTRPDDH